MSEQRTPEHSQISGCSIVIGLGLIAAGSLALAARFLDIPLWDWVGRLPWDYAWTLFIIGPGAVMLLVGLFGRRSSAGLVIPGCIVTTVGFIMLGQAVFDAWATWAYAWTIIIAAVGLGLFLFGVRARKSDVRRVGSVMLSAGLVAFVGFAFFFEVVVGLGGFFEPELRRAVWPSLIILAGIFIVISSFRSKRSVPSAQPGSTAPPAPEDVTTAEPGDPPPSA